MKWWKINSKRLHNQLARTSQGHWRYLCNHVSFQMCSFYLQRASSQPYPTRDLPYIFDSLLCKQKQFLWWKAWPHDVSQKLWRIPRWHEPRQSLLYQYTLNSKMKSLIPYRFLHCKTVNTQIIIRSTQNSANSQSGGYQKEEEGFF